jgi:hypothetical protein
MRYEVIKNRSDKDFKRLTGVQHAIFKQMVAVLEQEMAQFGRPPKLSRADQLLMTLMYWREYRTQFHIGQTYGISESAVCRTIQKVEDSLVESGQFTLPGKKTLQASETTIEIILVDATEQAIERPKKTTGSLQWQEKESYAKSTADCEPGHVRNHRHGL